MITNQPTKSQRDSFERLAPEGGHGGHDGHEPKVKQACELAAVRLPPEGWASRAPFLTAPARRPRALAAGVGRFSCHGHHGHRGHP